MQDEARLLEEAGHDIHVWMPSTEGLHGLSTLAAGAGTVWSLPAVRTARALRKTFQPELIHCHNLFPLVFDALVDGRVPQINGDDYPTPDGTNVRDYLHVADLGENDR